MLSWRLESARQSLNQSDLIGRNYAVYLKNNAASFSGSFSDLSTARLIWSINQFLCQRNRSQAKKDRESNAKLKKAKLWSCRLCLKDFKCKFSAERHLDTLHTSLPRLTSPRRCTVFDFLPCRSSDRWLGSQKLVLFWIAIAISKAKGSLC